MWPIKTNREIYGEYMDEIEKFEHQVSRHNSTIGRLEDEIKQTQKRIEELKETAEMYKPKTQ